MKKGGTTNATHCGAAWSTLSVQFCRGAFLTMFELSFGPCMSFSAELICAQLAHTLDYCMRLFFSIYSILHSSFADFHEIFQLISLAG